MNKKLAGFSIILLLKTLPLITMSQIQTLNGNRISDTLMDTFIETKIQTLNIPGLSIAFINNGQISYCKAFGYSDLEAKIKVDRQTIFEAASTIKQFFEV